MDPVDQALVLLRDLDHPVFSTHGPMAVEALEALGFPERAPAWACEYARDQGLQPLPVGVAAGAAAPRLGDTSRRGDFVAILDCETREQPWQEVVRRRLPALLPAVACEAAHGVIRVAHAVRSLRRRYSEPRRYELCQALGYWSATWEALPGAPGRGSPGLASQALARVPTISPAEQSYQGAITERLRSLRTLPGFEAAVSSLAPGDDLGAFADDLSRVAARLYLANASRDRVIDFIHALDCVYAIRELMPLLDEADARDALFYGWQTLAALHASAGSTLAPSAPGSAEASALPGLACRAVEIGGAHAIKFAQACIAEHANHPDALFPAALTDAITRMEEMKQKLGLVI